MTPDQLTDRIRRLAQTHFRDQGHAQPDDFQETLLVHNGFFCGRRFTSQDVSVVWFIEEHELKFYGPDGTVQQVLNVANLAADGEAA